MRARAAAKARSRARRALSVAEFLRPGAAAELPGGRDAGDLALGYGQRGAADPGRLARRQHHRIAGELIVVDGHGDVAARVRGELAAGRGVQLKPGVNPQPTASTSAS